MPTRFGVRRRKALAAQEVPPSIRPMAGLLPTPFGQPIVRVKLSALLFMASVATGWPVDPPRPDLAMPSFEKQWFGKHNYLSGLVTKASRNPPVNVYFLGDSITEFWPVVGKQVWNREFGQLRVVNCGVSGDTSQNILYRITHGEFDRIAPKVVVVLAGINNLSTSPQLRPDDLARGIRLIVATLRIKSPTSKVVLVSILPSGEANDPIRPRIVETNRRLATSATTHLCFSSISTSFSSTLTETSQWLYHPTGRTQAPWDTKFGLMRCDQLF